MPMTTLSILDSRLVLSVRTPQIFLPPTRISFGRLNSGSRLNSRFRISATERQATCVKMGALDADKGGRINKEKRRFFPFGDSHLRPGLPRPAVWKSAVM